MRTPVLEVRNLSKDYGHSRGLSDVSLAVEAGEIFGLLGPNGAGKTTLVSILSGLITPTSGEANIFGFPVNPRTRSVIGQIGLAPQELSLYGELTAEENVRFFGKLYGLHGQELIERTREVLADVGLTDRAGSRARTFSGGMKRRLNLAIAVVHRPKLLFLDEPTTGVDPQSRKHIFDRVKAWNKAGMTILYSSHYMEEVQALCDRIAILDHGRLIACDHLSALLRLLKGTIQITFAEPPVELPTMLAAIEGVSEVRLDGPSLTIHGDEPSESLPRILEVLDKSRLKPIRIEASRANLEQVFLHLTGHQLRD